MTTRHFQDVSLYIKVKHFFVYTNLCKNNPQVTGFTLNLWNVKLTLKKNANKEYVTKDKVERAMYNVKDCGIR